MSNIAIVEDEDAAAAVLTDYINRFGSESGSEFNIVRFSRATDFLRDYKSVYSVVFMDIQMPLLNGMDAAEELRKFDRVVSLVFITNMIQMAQKGYEVDAISFLNKPVSYSDFALKFKKALDVYAMNEERSVTIKVPNGISRVSSDKLMYVEVANHKLVYHFVDEVMEMSGSLAKAERALEECNLLKCNSCYLVNPKFITAVKGLELKVGSETLRISRPKRKSFMIELTNWFAGKK